MRLIALTLLAAVCCIACGSREREVSAVETVKLGSVLLQVEAAGEIRAAEATPLRVPGRRWTQRQPVWVLSDGEPVAAGDLIARFSAQQSELELAQIVIDLQRNQLSRIARQALLDSDQRQVDIDLVDVATRLAIARRYADIDLASYLSRNDVLDALDDEKYLLAQRDVLQWKANASDRRGAIELGVFDAQQVSHERNADVRRKDVDASELRAPHAGKLMLVTDWAGDKPRAGINMMAGQVLGFLPNIDAVNAELKVPQAAAESLRIGQKVRVHLLGRSAGTVQATLSWISVTALPRARDNPALYVTVRAPIPAESVHALGLMPGMRVQAQIDLIDVASGISVPNMAVVEAAGKNFVHVKTAGAVQRRAIELGVRGTARSEVLKGLHAGDLVLLTPPRNESETAVARASELE